MTTVVNNSSAETAIAALAKRFWSIHPKEIQDLGITREQFYEREMRSLFASLTTQPQAAQERRYTQAEVIAALKGAIGDLKAQEIAPALSRPSQRSEPQTLTVTPEMVEAVRKAKCFACGAFPYEDCQRHPQRDCGREFNGGSRKAKKA